MNSNFSFTHPFIFFFFLSIHTFFIDLPVSFGEDDLSFPSCSKRFECGEIRNLSYPFWGDGRPAYCGHPDFGLNCTDGNIVEMVLDSHTYRVLNITDTIRIAPVETWNDDCPSPIRNVSLPCNIFNCSLPSEDGNLTLAYGCPFPQPTTGYKFPCSRNGIVGENYYWIDSPTPDRSGCNYTITMPILRRLVPGLVTRKLDLEEVLKQGFEVEYLSNGSFCATCDVSGGQCGYNWSTYQHTCFCYNGSSSTICLSRPGTNTRQKLGIGLGASIGCVLVTVILFLSCKRRQSSVKPIIFWKRNNKEQRMVEIFLENCGSMAPKRYSYSDIKKITSSFKDKIGQGGYGEVYKGKLLDGRLVAVKSLKKGKGNGEEFINEVASISKTSHVNIVSLLGFCFDGSKRALVYEFMENGSLEKFINDHNSLGENTHLGWEALFQIALGVARGLEYLHRGCNTLILHFDIKPHNILLDRNFNPKISDFGLAKLYLRDESITSMLHARGTFGYIAPEMIYRNYGKVSHKSDVYSYGMMVLDVVGQRKKNDGGFDHSSDIYFPQWIYKSLEQDEDLGLCEVTSQEEKEITRKMILVALWCIQTKPVDRPAMSRVVEMLEGKLELLSVPSKPYLSSPPRSHIGSSSTLENSVSLLNSQNKN